MKHSGKNFPDLLKRSCSYYCDIETNDKKENFIKL